MHKSLLPSCCVARHNMCGLVFFRPGYYAVEYEKRVLSMFNVNKRKCRIMPDDMLNIHAAECIVRVKLRCTTIPSVAFTNERIVQIVADLVTTDKPYACVGGLLPTDLMHTVCSYQGSICENLPAGVGYYMGESGAVVCTWTHGPHWSRSRVKPRRSWRQIEQ